MPFDHFNFIAPLYNRNYEYSNLDLMIELARLPIKGSLLDVGGGTGRVAGALRDQAAAIIVADPSRRMLQYAKSKPGLLSAAAFSEHLPFPDNFFQRVIMVDAFHHVEDQTRTAWELLRASTRWADRYRGAGYSDFGSQIDCSCRKAVVDAQPLLFPGTNRFAFLNPEGECNFERFHYMGGC